MTEQLAAAVDSAALDDLRRRAAETDDLRRAIAKRIGVPVDAAPSVIMAALDEALAELAEDLPAGVVTLDEAALAELRADAEVGRNLRRNELIESAILDGRIPPAARGSWEALYDTDPASAETAIRKIRKGTIPLSPIGYSGNDDDPADIGSQLFGWT